MSMKAKAQQGFTLIELMIVVAIIGILAAIALPAYQDYIAKAQVSEPVTQADGIKLKVREYFEKEGACPANATVTAGDKTDQYGIAAKANYVFQYTASIETAGTADATGGCTVTATFKGSNVNVGLQGKKLVYTLQGMNQNVPKWKCTTDVTNTNYKFLPEECRQS